MEQLNYHHLRYFRQVAHEGNLTRAAERLNLSQSALSTQIKTLEARIGHPLFARVGRALELTEEGRIALDYADRIFETGDELLATLSQTNTAMPPLRVGALSTLSRNFQMQFLAPVLERSDVEIVLRSGSEDDLLADLDSLNLDVMLTTAAPRRAIGPDITAHRLADQPVAIHGRPDLIDYESLKAMFAAASFILPTEPTLRSGFFGLADQLDVQPRIVADVDDMAMVRLLARAGAGLAVAPSVVVADELANGRLVTSTLPLHIHESFFAVTRSRRFPHPLLAHLLDAAREATKRR
ncbi:LysR family transcriptional regulator [Nereida sp. MMG025]|uniref:LysR family transcriptional regulator n=1 Tax=Nereida sp. MMG025 TaxID=2909981 RepID=UPI001F186FE8|nr:LysR family transcriptional regulator [Nereida sp. MMG025]MCF6444832.1 LysR family transcriptional regulator [Nereida sp. MMG025]